jgi:hypothetical protein
MALRVGGVACELAPRAWRARAADTEATVFGNVNAMLALVPRCCYQTSYAYWSRENLEWFPTLLCSPDAAMVNDLPHIPHKFGALDEITFATAFNSSRCTRPGVGIVDGTVEDEGHETDEVQDTGCHHFVGL